MSTIRVRFAPSPTGHLHIGGVRTAMFNWILARSQGGVYLLRIEDTDRERSSDEYRASQLASLKWLNLEPDEPLVFQYERAPEHRQEAARLMREGKAYPCFCEREDADEVVERLEQGIGNKYDRTCRDKSFTDEDLRRPHAIRFKTPDHLRGVSFTDQIRGEISIMADQLDDFVIIRRDQTPVYNFCVVVDDIFMKITHIVRGEDHISNTFKQCLLYSALGAERPVFAHLPLILSPSGGKLSKRDVAVSVESYREMGILADALFNYLVRLGWSFGDQEIFSRDEMVQHFSLENVGKKGAMFDMKKLLWINGVYMRKASVDELLTAIQAMDHKLAASLLTVWGDEKLRLLIGLFKDRTETLRDCAESIGSFAVDPSYNDLEPLKPWLTSHTRAMLALFQQVLTSAGDDIPLIDHAKNIARDCGEKLVNLAQPLRYAMTGSVQSPGIFELINLIGKESAIRRIERLVQQFPM